MWRLGWALQDLAGCAVNKTDDSTPKRESGLVTNTILNKTPLGVEPAWIYEIDGEPVAVGALRRWKRAAEPRILWFTVEGFTPYLPLHDLQGFDRFRFQEFFRADWPRTWSVPGDRSDRQPQDGRAERRPPRSGLGP